MQSPFSGSHLCLITVEDTGPLFPLQSTSKEESLLRHSFKQWWSTLPRRSATHHDTSPRVLDFTTITDGLGRKGLLAKNIEQRGRRTRTKTGQWRLQFVARRLPLPAFLGRFRPWFHILAGERKAFTFRCCLKLPY